MQMMKTMVISTEDLTLLKIPIQNDHLVLKFH